jgi:hypothetical protein
MEYTKGEHYINVLDAEIEAIRDESQQYRVTLMAHMSGQRDLEPGAFEWNRGMLTRCTTEIKILKKVKRQMLGQAPTDDTDEEELEYM